MSPTITPPKSAAGLRVRLAEADRVYQRQRGKRFALLSVKFFGCALLVMFAADVLSHFSGMVRLALALGFGTMVVAVLAIGHWIAWHQKNRLEFTARLLESRDPSLGSSLINMLQLERDAERPDRSSLSAMLAREAVEECRERLEPVDFRKLAAAEPPHRERKQALWVAAGLVAILALTFPVSSLEVLRFIDPLGDHPPFSLTRLTIEEPTDDSLRVVYDQGAMIKVAVAGHRPDELFLSFFDPAHPEEVTTLPMFDKAELGFVQQIENIRTDLAVFAHTRDRKTLSRQRMIEVILTPRIESGTIEVIPPSYTGVAGRERPFDFKSVQALVGSRIRFQLESNRPLSGGSIGFTGGASGNLTTKMVSTGEKAVAGGMIVSQSGTLEFAVADVDGIESAERPAVPLTVTLDLAPDVQIENPPNDSFVTENYTVEGRIVASDDYGVRTVRIHRALNGIHSPPLIKTYAIGTPRPTERMDLPLRELGVRAGDVISFYAEAIDTAPEPQLARSKTVNLMVITEEEYNDYLRERSDIADLQQKFTSLVNALQDLVDQQRKLEAAMEKARSENPDDPAAAAELAKKQSALNERLNGLAKQMEEFVRDKPLYDVEKEFSEILKAQAEKIRASTAENRDALEAAGQQPAGESLESLQEAAEKQLANLGSPQDAMEQQVMAPIEEMRLMDALVKDFNFFKRLYEIQAGVAGQTATYKSGRDLTSDDKLALKQLAATEKEVEMALEKMVGRLRRNAEAAGEKFPKAAESARDLADGIEQARLSHKARETSRTMLVGEGGRSHAMAEGLRAEMEAFFQQCEAGQGRMGSEMDQYLGLQRSLPPGQTFQQMMMSRKFGNSGGSGGGASGYGGMGHAMSTGPNFGVLGAETMGGAGASEMALTGGQSQDGPVIGGNRVGETSGSGLENVESGRVHSEAVRTETSIDDYREVVDAYFDSITR